MKMVLVNQKVDCVFVMINFMEKDVKVKIYMILRNYSYALNFTIGFLLKL